jgi:dTDP-glucose 4,6-dehydratase
MKSVLITGGAGFIGSHVVIDLCNKYPEYKFVNLDKLTYAANLKNLKAVESLSNYTFIQQDIANYEGLEELFSEYKFTDVIHLAAESHVDNSINGPKPFIDTNLIGTFNLLECCRKNWLDGQKDHHRFVHISTDEVYGSLGDEGEFTETTAMAPNSPYSASKAGSDLLVRSYFKTYGLPVVTTNCSNNYGPHQHDEKLIPTVIRTAVKGQPIPVYGTGKNIRDWLFVKDHSAAIELCWNKGQTGETYNIGGNNEIANIELVQRICLELDNIQPKESGSYQDQIEFVTDRPGHDWRYAVSTQKIHRELDWQPTTDFTEALHVTIKWYLEKYNR